LGEEYLIGPPVLPVPMVVAPMAVVQQGIARRSNVPPTTMTAERGHTVQPQSEWDRQTDRRTDHSIALSPLP